METFAQMNNDDDYETKMKFEKEALKTAFNNEFLVEISNTKHKWYQSQTATVQALQFGMVPENDIENVVNGLAHDIVEVKDGHHSTGIHGNRYIYTVLSKYGKADLAYQILTTPEFPSQTYVMNSGFTTWPERQFEWEKMEGPTNSLNHPMHSGFAAYFYESLGGVKSSGFSPGYKIFVVNPEFPSAISTTEVDVPTPYGAIRNEWNYNNGKLSMNLKVPFNTEAKVIVTQSELESFKINGKSLEEFKEQHSFKITEDAVIVGSGDYQITYLKN
ncbi:alfa-L-rhamnosidase [Nonlabens tegetincola]|uniref:alpha-L-rhamnosidase n=2 Tax=Nonlabens tegetincola TaxID=323273 RepID=A0A090QRF0_9FLAO|nr:alfa-L-rhamnosidase [Nonlabens tegetincola]